MLPSSSGSRGQRIDSDGGGGDKGKSVGNVFFGGSYGNSFNSSGNASGGNYSQNVGSDVGRFGVRARKEGRIGNFSGHACNKCKDTRHTTKECILGHCVICGKDSHITNECTWLKQMKHVPKYVGYAARGLGGLHVQSSKYVLVVEHANPMAIVWIKSRKVNETRFLQGFNNMFS